MFKRVTETQEIKAGQVWKATDGSVFGWTYNVKRAGKKRVTFYLVSDDGRHFPAEQIPAWRFMMNLNADRCILEVTK